MKVKITRPCVIEVLPGTVAEVSEEQLKYIPNYCELIGVEKETPEAPKKTTKKAKK